MPTTAISPYNAAFKAVFSKLQIYILAACLVITAIAFAVWGFHAVAPLREAAAANAPSSTDAVPESPQPDQSIPHGTLKPYVQPRSASIITNGNEPDEKIVDAVMAKLADSFKKGDWAAAIDEIYPPILEAVGGRKKALQDLETLKAQMKEESLSMSWSFKKPYIFIAGGSHKYAVVPYECDAKVSGKLLKQSNYQLGIKTDDGWKFVGGDRLSPELYERFFPDFPKDFELPEFQQVWD